MLIPRFTAASVFFDAFGLFDAPVEIRHFVARQAERGVSAVSSPDRLRRSLATASKARATTARRKSSDSGPSSLTKAATSHDESKTFVSCRTTVDIERPREGGAAINCSQITSRHFSASIGSERRRRNHYRMPQRPTFLVLRAARVSPVVRPLPVSLTRQAALAGDFAARAGERPAARAQVPAGPRAPRSPRSSSAKNPSNIIGAAAETSACVGGADRLRCSSTP